MRPTSAGFLIRSNGMYLLGHATQPDSYQFNPTDRNWTIPKGVMDPGETTIAAAIRETFEETGVNVLLHFKIDLEMKPHCIINTKQKDIVVFLIDDPTGKVMQLDFECKSIIVNKKLPHMNGKPEIDMFMWANRKQAESLVFNSLKILFSE